MIKMTGNNTQRSRTHQEYSEYGARSTEYTGMLKMCWKGCFIFSVLLLLIQSSPTNAWNVPLPAEFTLQTSASKQGVELVWTSNVNIKMRVGGARPEFRITETDTDMVRVLGYPLEINGNLHLSVSNANQNALATNGLTLQVWSAGRRLDTNGGFSPSLRPGGNGSGSDGSGGGGGLRFDGKSKAVPTTPTINVDPARRGRFTTARKSYSLEDLDVSYPELVEVLAEVTFPSSPTIATKLPLVLFLHGRHVTCYSGDDNTGFVDISWPCNRRTKPIPSHQGYRYVADILASQGYLVVSISANGINGQDGYIDDAGASGRSQLIRHHLNVWAEWNTEGGDPWNSQFLDRVDMTQVVLVGHSRGGEGVHRAAVDATSTDPYTIVGLVSYGPTAFRQIVTPDIHSVTILPTCDGDVSDLQGQAYVDISRDLAYSEALRSAVISLGSNHNYFNTEWTPGLSKAPSSDDWFDNSDPICGSRKGRLRLTPKEQQSVGAAYTAALVRLVVRQDAAMLPLLDGSFVRPAAIGRADIAVNAVGGANYRLLFRPKSNDTAVSSRNGMETNECTATFDPTMGFPSTDDFSFPFPDDISGPFTDDIFGPSRPPKPSNNSDNSPADGLFCGEFSSYISPHWQPLTARPIVHALELTWQNSKKAMARFAVTKEMKNLTGLDWVDVRIINDPTRNGATFRLVVVDRNGKNVTLPSNLTTIKSWPGRDGLDRYHARTLRGSIAAVRTRVDLSRIETIALVALGTAGKVWVLDIAASQARVVRPTSLGLPKISVESREVLETDGLKTYKIKILADKPLKTSGTIWVQPGSLTFSAGYFLELAPGNTVVAEIPVESDGDNVYLNATNSFGGFPGSSGSSTNSFSIEAVSGVVATGSTGSLTVIEDEPAPTITITPSTAIAVESKSLQWTLKLSGGTAGITLFFTAIPPVTAEELTSHDVPASWIEAMGSSRPSTPLPLSDLFMVIPVRFDYGVTTATLRIPVLPDGKAEGDKLIVLQTLAGFSSFDLGRLSMIGQVKAHR